jgi:hypothetical protein
VTEDADTCDVCSELWEVRFEWDYTSPEHYCRGHLLEPIDGQPGKTLLDFMPDCQRITHRMGGRSGHRRSTRELQVVLTGRL